MRRWGDFISILRFNLLCSGLSNNMSSGWHWKRSLSVIVQVHAWLASRLEPIGSAGQTKADTLAICRRMRLLSQFLAVAENWIPLCIAHIDGILDIVFCLPWVCCLFGVGQISDWQSRKRVTLKLERRNVAIWGKRVRFLLAYLQRPETSSRTRQKNSKTQCSQPLDADEDDWRDKYLNYADPEANLQHEAFHDTLDLGAAVIGIVHSLAESLLWMGKCKAGESFVLHTATSTIANAKTSRPRNSFGISNGIGDLKSATG